MTSLNPIKDYGFTDLSVPNTERLPVWDRFRLEKIGEIFSTCHTILDIGGSSRWLFELFAEELRDKERLSVDIDPASNPDVVADICDLHMFDDESVDGIICAAILEHVHSPHKAVSELFRVLKRGGKMFVFVPWLSHYHGPSTKAFYDYYRFSRDAVHYLFRDFSHIELSPLRGCIETILNLIPLFWKTSPFHRLFGRWIRKVDIYDERFASGYNIYLVK